MSNIQIEIMLKNVASDCNKEVLEFLHRNIGKIKMHFSLKVVIVTQKLNHKLPAAKIDGNLVVGKTAIIEELKTSYAEKIKPKTDDDVVRSYMDSQMATGDNEDSDRSGDIAKKLAAEAFRTREQNSTSRNSNVPKSNPKSSSFHKTSKKQAPVGDGMTPGQSLPSDLEKDPLMAKFWANQGM